MFTFWSVVHLFTGWFGAATILGVLAMAGWVASFALPNVTILQTLRGVLFTVGAVCLTSAYIYGSAYRDGYNYAVHQIAVHDADVGKAVEEATTTVDKCYDDGGTWDSVTGKCTYE